MEQKELEKRLTAIKERQKELNADYKEFRILAKEHCTHPNTYETYKDCDNGYGKWWRIHWDICLTCGKQNSPYNKDKWT